MQKWLRRDKFAACKLTRVYRLDPWMFPGRFYYVASLRRGDWENGYRAKQYVS